jgi:TP901 family phage tail tape measure protein
MADKIEQQFLIEAGQSFAVLSSLNAAYANFNKTLAATEQAFKAVGTGPASKSIAGLSRSLGGANTSARNLTGTITQLNTAISNLPAGKINIQSGLTGLNTEARSAIGNFGALGNLLQAFSAYQGFRIIRDQLKEAVVNAAELQKQTALIQTIATSSSVAGATSRSNPVATSAVTDGTRALSDSLNIPQLEVAKGLYQAISNQVGSFGESLIFAAEAGKFARATNSSLADSVDTISAVLKSYNLDVSQSADISNTLFNIIDKGRISANELGSSLGRILPAASELGVGLDEVGASLSTISVKGLSTAETITQLRATFSGLLKPSDALKESFTRLGVESASLGIQKFGGLIGFLDAIQKDAGGSSSQLAKLFPNVRNLGAVLALTGTNAGNAAESLKFFQENVSSANSAFNTVTSTDIEVVSSAYNQFRNVLTDLGSEYIKTARNAIEFGGSLGNEAAFETLVKGTVNAAVGLGVVVSGLVAARGAVLAFNAASALLAINPIILAAGAVAGLAIAANQLQSAAEELRADNIKKGLTDLGNVRLADLKKELAELATESKKTTADLKTLFTATLQGLDTAGYEASISKLVTANGVYVDSVKDTLNRIADLRAAFSNALKQEADQARQDAENSRKRVLDLQGGQESTRFNRRLESLPESQRGAELLARASKLAAQAEANLRSATAAGDEDGQARARNLFEAAKAAAIEAENTGKSANSTFQITNARQKLDAIIAKEIQSEQSLQSIRANRAKQLDAEAIKQAKISEEIRRQAKVVVDNSSRFDAQGNAFDSTEQARRAAARNAALSKISELQVGQNDVKLADQLGLAAFAQELESKLGGLQAEVAVEILGGGDQLTEEINQAVAKFNSDPFLQKLLGVARSFGIEIENAVSKINVEDVIKRVTDASATQQRTRSELASSTGQADANRLNGNEQADALARSAAELLQTKGAEQLGAAVQATVERAKAVLAENPLTLNVEEAKTQLDELGQKIKESANPSNETSQVAKDGAVQYSLLIESIRAYLLNIEEVQAKQKIINEQPVGAQNMTDLSSIINTQVTPSISSATTAMGNLGAAAEDALNRVSNAIAAISSARSAGAAVNANTGGFIRHYNTGGPVIQHFNSGGTARGTDTIPALLAPGESVINARQTGNFFSQIRAMNAGQFPSARSGSEVTNVGDINVHINGATPNAATTGREIANILRRELRRGTSRL